MSSPEVPQFIQTLISNKEALMTVASILESGTLLSAIYWLYANGHINAENIELLKKTLSERDRKALTAMVQNIKKKK